MKKLSFLFVFNLIFLFVSCSSYKSNQTSPNEITKQATSVLKAQVMEEAEWALQQNPETVTANSSKRSAGGLHDFYSEGDYWWPDPNNPDGPYIQRDGVTNPDNFIAHRLAMIRFSKIMGALASAYKITKDEKYVKHAVIHLKAWFLNADTKMNANLQYAQAIKGITTGRGIGIIDTIQLMEVAQAVLVMENSKWLDPASLSGIKNWFNEYITWLSTSKNGLDEKNAKNNHGTCWVMQVASFAKLCENKAVLDSCRKIYKTVLLPNQMASDGSFPLELARTKPYGYSIFNLDAMSTICQILSTPSDNLWNYETSDGKSIKKGITYLYPFLADKNQWAFKQDVMYWENWPVAQPALIFGANAYQQQNWFNTWKNLDHQPQVLEVIRNLPIRHPLIWFH